MSQLLPVRHPNKDFFIVDVKDASPKDDMASMEHPIFSLAVKPDMRELDYKASDGRRLRIIPSGLGLATIMDKDIVLYCISKLIDRKNKGEEISQIVELTAHEAMIAINWRTNKESYERFENALIRLTGTIIHTDIPTGGGVNTHGEGIIKSYDIERKGPDGKKAIFGRMSKVRIELSDWLFRSVQASEVLTITTEYFRLRRPLERRLYEIARKHAGNKSNSWKISIEKLKEKVGTSAPLKRFRHNLKEIIKDSNVPDYGFMLEGDNVVIQKLISVNAITGPASYIPLRPDTLDKAQKIAAEIGTSVFELEREWNEWIADKQQDKSDIKTPDGAFLGFCKQKLATKGARAVTSAREEAQQIGLAF